MPDVREVARGLLESGAVDVVIGYASAGEHRTRPYAARSAEDADRLVFSHSALNNLAVYLTRAKRPAGARIGIVAKGCDARAIVMLIQERQVAREDVVIIGVNCSGVTSTMGEPFGPSTMAGKCARCTLQIPPIHDALAEEGVPFERPEDPAAARIRALEALDPEQRFVFWRGAFERCIRCNACRQVCPLCYCDQCVADRNMPQWIDTSATQRGSFAWNVMRAMHLGGRCVGCSECERACPAGIPLSLLNGILGVTAAEEFGYHAGMDPAGATLIGTYDAADRQQYIL